MADDAVLLTVAYDGTDFAGWQRQPGQRTVQGVLDRAVEAMDGRPALTRGASRTDAGVHALGQRVAFDPERSIPLTGWVRGLNVNLPEDVAVRAAEHRPRGYDPRFDASGKHYRYLIHTAPTRDPLLRHRAWHVGRALDLGAMRAAGRELVGTHDFAAFQAANDHRDNTVRTLTRVDVEAGGPDVIAIDVEGNAFLKNMVRILAGTLVEAGRGRFEVARVRALLRPGSGRPEAGPTAPAEGLTLVSIRLGRRHP